MKYLVIDTSTQYSVVSVLDKNGFIGGKRCLFKRWRSKLLIDLIENVLSEANLSLEQIDLFGAGIGPGSFTGLRIGLSVVKALSFALNKSVVVFSSLDAIAENDTGKDKHSLCVLLDAKRGNVYYRFYDVVLGKGPILGNQSRHSLIGKNSFLKKVKGSLTLAGDGVGLYQTALEERSSKLHVLPEALWYPTPEGIAQLTLKAFKKSKPVNCFKLLPKYMYAKDCQVNKKQVTRHKKLLVPQYPRSPGIQEGGDDGCRPEKRPYLNKKMRKKGLK